MWRGILSCWGAPGGSGNINKGVKDQGSSDNKLYSLVDIRGGGILIDLMTKGHSNEYIDNEIRKELSPFLYENGDGKYVDISAIIKIRKGGNNLIEANPETNLKQNSDDVMDRIFCYVCNTFKSSQKNSPQRTKCCYKNMEKEKFKSKLTCWDITKRGTVGETVLHMCFLNSSETHKILAKRLLHLYPCLIKDFYIDDMYYGETVLHMAIANSEDPVMVRYLLDNGADVNQRCCGKFFCPKDQKTSQRDCKEHEWFDVSRETNYKSDLYLGEYALCFAACLNLEACVRLLHNKGADLRSQDSNGNTVFHLMVIKDNKNMLDVLMGLDKTDRSALLIPNRQNLTPLTLAAKLARRSMYEHILKIQREHKWTYGDVSCAAYPLKHIDTITAEGDINPDSVLGVIVYGDEEGHLDMMHGLIVKLLEEKWKTFVRFRFYRRFLIFVLYFIASCSAFALRPGTDLYPTNRTVNVTTNGVSEMTVQYDIDPCYLMKVYTYRDVIRMVFECFLFLCAAIYTCLALKELIHQGRHIFLTTLSGAPAKFLFHVSCICVILMVPGRASCSYKYEDIVSVFVILCTAPYFLFFCRGFHIIGPFVVMIYKMIKGDLLRFFTIYAIFVVGFSQAMYLCFIRATGVDSPFRGRGETILALFSMSVGEFEDFYGDFDHASHEYLSKFVFVLYMILVTLLLVNMLIAMMGNTYQLINNIQKEWFRQWSKVVLVFEQSVTKQQRKKFQILYSEPHDDNTDERDFILRWQLTEKEYREQKEKLEEEWNEHNQIIQKKSPKKHRRQQMA